MILVKIYLYLDSRIMTFDIPVNVSGSFSFDENPEEEAKLINIDATDQGWILYSTSDAKVLENGNPVEQLSLKPDNYYIIKRSNKNYLIYVSESFDNSFKSFTYNDGINLTIGNDQTSNIVFPTSLIKGTAARIYKYQNGLVVDVNETNVYINNKLVTRSNYPLKIGDTLNIYGLKVVVLNGLILINNPMNSIQFNLTNTTLGQFKFPEGTEPQDEEIRDRELYTKEDYFSKSPRIRRLIKTKEIEFSAPPKAEGEKELPLILTIGPMATMAILAGVRLASVISNIASGKATLGSQVTQLVQSVTMLLAMLLWPILTRMFNRRLKEKKKKELIEKYNKYLEGKRKELTDETKLQRDILIENLIPVEQCLKIIDAGNINFWDKRVEQNDFLELRLGVGNQLLDVEINFPKDGFTIEEDELKKQAEKLIEEFKYIRNVPIGYSLYKNKITAMMGEKETSYGMMNNLILQLITFYSYEDVKLVVFTNKQNEKNWDYLRYLNHSFSNDRSIRFFSTDMDEAKELGDYLNMEIVNRMNGLENGINSFKPYYVIICDDYSMIKRQSFRKLVTEIDENIGFSIIILENQMSNLPSKCNNFIYVGRQTSSVLTNSFEEQERLNFSNEINDSINMMQIVKKLSNIPIEFEEGFKELPESISFLEMEKVGKVEQLNIMNRWQQNDSTKSLRAEVGVDDEGNYMYLDLHEKYHGPHGLIAGMTGSGKSEFIITYILSMAVNYSPDYVSFILIDYKGGGLAGAFENKMTGITLPHLAGTITNLDKAEMDRTLVSIQSELQRRQQVFNEARDELGESTIDIYKYQAYYKEGRLTEPVPHLFIICDEFAELKAQQPDFMDNLISVARIGRSLGVHLILATQKPTGVVNDQIWSNTKFRVCLKVQDASDSKEMLKRPDAANLKQTGRFYLQVGYDEYFALGQSAWCGAKYYPSEKIIKQVDKSINFIDDSGDFIKSIQAGNNIKIEAQGEQLAAIMKEIIKVADMSKKKANRLWLNDIDPIILVDDLTEKYKLEPKKYDVKAIIGEYDAPERQEQGLLEYSLSEDGNTLIIGNDAQEKEKMLSTIIYSLCKNHTAEEVNIYAIDYGSESLNMLNGFPQIGGMAFLGEDEKFKNLFKLITDEIKERKKLLVNYGGSLETYNSRNEEKLPLMLFIINNYEGVLEAYNTIHETIASLTRDCERYGIYMIITANTVTSIGRRIHQNFPNRYAFHLTDQTDYYTVFNKNTKTRPRERFGRGLVDNEGIHEFQTASIVDEEGNIVKKIEEEVEKQKSICNVLAKPIPELPDKVTFDIIEKNITTLTKVPIGINKVDLRTVKYDFMLYPATIVSANKIESINSFMDSLVDILLRINNTVVFFFDFKQQLDLSNKECNGRKVNYCADSFEQRLDQLIQIEKNPNNKDINIIYIMYGIEKAKTKIGVKKLDEFFELIKNSDNSRLIIADRTKALKSIDLESWYSKIKNNSDGIWIGKGFPEQTTFRISKITKEMTIPLPNNYGLCITENDAEIIKMIEFNDMLKGEEELDEE